MDILTLILIACSLAMDAFAVSVSSGMLMCRARFGQTLRIAGSFGFSVRHAADRIWGGPYLCRSYRGGGSLGGVLFIGLYRGKMVYDALSEKEDETPVDPCNVKSLLILSIATSIDALAVGASLP